MRLVVINRQYNETVMWLAETPKVVLPVVDLAISIVHVVHAIQSTKLQVCRWPCNGSGSSST